MQQDGSKRLLGQYREASWSPFGRFVVAARENELAALEPDGDVRWTLARPGVRFPRWTGTETDTRIAYVDRTGIRVVAGDGTGDRLLVPRAPRPDRVASGRWLRARATPIGGASGARRRGRPGQCSGATRPRRTRTRTSSGRRTDGVLVARRPCTGRPARSTRRRAPCTTGFRTRGAGHRRGARAPRRTLGAVALQANAQHGYFLPDVPGSALSGPGALATSRGHPTAAGCSSAGRPPISGSSSARTANGIRAVSNVSEQFRSRSFPRIQGWCCGPWARLASCSKPAPRSRRPGLDRAARGASSLQRGAREPATRSSASTSGTGRPPERPSCTSCVTGATTSRRRESGRSRSRATRHGRTGPGRRRSVSTSRCCRTGTARRSAHSTSRSSRSA